MPLLYPPQHSACMLVQSPGARHSLRATVLTAHPCTGCTVVEMLTGRPPWARCDNPFTAMYLCTREEEPLPIPEGLSGPVRDFLELCFVRNSLERATSKVCLIVHMHFTFLCLRTPIKHRSN